MKIAIVRFLQRYLGRLYSLMLGITLLCVFLYFIGLDTSLAFRRDEIANGDYWRLFTGNFLHTNAWHLVMNLAGLWVITLLHQNHYSPQNFSLLFISCCIAQGLGLYLFFPSLVGYVGLSGMLHALFTYGALKDISIGLKSGYLLLIGVVLKVIYEQVFGAGEQITEMIGARVATEAHLVGVITGLLFYGFIYLIDKGRKV